MEYKTPKEIADFCKDERERETHIKTATFTFDIKSDGLSITKKNDGFNIIELLGLIEILNNQLLMEMKDGKG